MRKGEGQAGVDETEITEEMIAAGVAELNACLGAYAENDLVAAVYTAMRERELPRRARASTRYAHSATKQPSRYERKPC